MIRSLPVGANSLLNILSPEEVSADSIDPSTLVSNSESVERDKLPIRLATLGCKVNQYETEFVRELLQANGYRPAIANEKAVLAIVNTCTVTAESDRKSRQLIRQFARNNPGVKIIVMGCYATADPNTVRAIPGVAAVITDKADLAASLKPFGVEKTITGIKQFQGRHRAFVKVQDGCILNCTFCIIPSVRPGLLSRPMDAIVTEVENLVEAGFHEIVLSGIHLGHYGVDLSQGLPKSEWRRLWNLLDRLSNLPGDFRIRLSSLETSEVTDDFIAVLADHQDRICPHLHLSLQSGSNSILKAMKRRYRIERFLSRVDEIKRRLDQPAFSTDIIVGFPGETEEDFQATLAAVRNVGFSKIHIFPFSPRKGTEAEHFADAVPSAVASDRRIRLAEVEREQAGLYYRSLVGRQLSMLVETSDPDRPGWMKGTACRYAPLRLRTLPGLAGTLVDVKVREVVMDALDVEPVAASP